MRRAASLLLLVLVAGCGSGGGSLGADPRDYRTEAERICVQGNDDAYDLSERLKKAQEDEPDRATFFAEVADITKDSVRTARPYIDRLAALERPADDEDELERWLADQRRRLTMLERLGDAYERQDEAAVAREAAALDELEERLSAFAKDYGIGECAAGR